ncbi:panthothenate synthetase [Thiovulum sp. ES]|nr:panthothenate synthetase [Thiovulum sp. ES]
MKISEAEKEIEFLDLKILDLLSHRVDLIRFNRDLKSKYEKEIVRKLIESNLKHNEVIPQKNSSDILFRGTIPLNSRKEYFTESQRELARKIRKSLNLGRELLEKGETWETALEKIKSFLNGTQIEYIDFRRDKILIALMIGETRLIDNMEVRIET